MLKLLTLYAVFAGAVCVYAVDQVTLYKGMSDTHLAAKG
jgi:hypothetical protein